MPDERSSETAAPEDAAAAATPPQRVGPLARLERLILSVPRALEELMDTLLRHIHTTTGRHDDLVAILAHIDERLSQMPTLADLQAAGTKATDDIAAAVTELKAAIAASQGEIPQAALDVVTGIGTSTVASITAVTDGLKPAPATLPAVADFSASANGNAGELVLSGTLPPGAAGFHVFLNGSTTVAASGIALPFTLTGQPSGTPVSVAIAAFDASGTVGTLSAPVSATPT